MLGRSGTIALGTAVLVGIWGGVIPFIGPLFGYDMGSEAAWVLTESRITIHLLPALAVVIGGLVGLMASTRRTARIGSMLVVLGGAWFVVGPSTRALWADGGGMMMMGASKLSGFLSALGYHYGTGVVIGVLGAFALGHLAAAPAGVPVAETETGTRGRRLGSSGSAAPRATT